MALAFRTKFLKKITSNRSLLRISSKLISRNHAVLNVSQQEPKEFEEKVALITGGASGIGCAIAKELLRKNIAAVALVDTDNNKGQEVAKELAKEYGDEKVVFIEADVGDSKQLDKAFKKTILHFDTISMVINNAGIMNDTKWEQQIRTNLSGTVIGTLLGMQYMSKSASGDGGTIVNVGSIMSIIPSSGYPLHTMTQFGIVGFTRALGCGSHYSRTAVKVIGICPGLTNSNLLKEAASNAINDHFLKEFTEETGDCQLQTPDSVAKGLLSIMDDAKPGSIWIAENKAIPYEVTFPETTTFKMKKANA